MLVSIRYDNGYTYTCGLLRCSFRQGWAMRDAKTVGRVTGTATHTFLYHVPTIFPSTSLCRVAQGATWPTGLIIYMKKKKRLYVVPKMEVYKLGSKCLLLAGSDGTGDIPENPNIPI